MVEDRATHSEVEAFEEGWTQARQGVPLLRGHPVGTSRRRTLVGFPPRGYRPRRAGVDCRSATMQASGWISKGGFSGTSTRKAPWRGTRRLVTGRSLPDKEWRRRRQYKTRKGYRAHGGGRRLDWTSGSSHCPTVPGGSHSHRVGARASSRPSFRPWPAAHDAATAHLRQGRRQRRRPAAAQEERDRTDLHSSFESQKADVP